VEPIYVQLEKFQRGLITRREFLKRAVALGFATPALIAALEGCGQAQQTASSAQPGAKLSAPKPSADEVKNTPLIMRGWAYEVATVEDNAKKFNTQYDENLDYKTISGDYDMTIGTMLQNKEQLDLFYGHDIAFARYYGMGQLVDYGSWWDIDKAKSEMYPYFARAFTSKDGKLFALPYFQGIRGSMVVNTALLKKAGMDTYQLTTWPDLYDLCRKLKKDGVAKTPLLPHWFAGDWAITWAFLWECLNRGIKLFDADNDFKPLFDENHEAVKVLEDWYLAMKDGIVPDNIFTLQEGDFPDAFAKGEMVFSAQQSYDCRRLNDPSRSRIAGMVDFATPPKGKSWGKIEMCGYFIGNKQRDDKLLSRVYRLNSFYGYRDKDGKLFVAKRWAMEQALGSGYKEILQDKEVLDALLGWMPGKERQFKDMQTYFDQAEWDRFYHCPWHSEFLSAFRVMADPVILGKKTPKDGIKELREASDKLYEKFKGKIKL
jgi:ABC-type glycerol-3-phosphate transport system substrate-binding protein